MLAGSTPLHWGRWHSLRWRLPFTISLVVTAILGVVLVFAYREVESALISAGVARARVASSQVAALAESSLRPTISVVRTAATAPALRDYLKDRSIDRREALEAELRKLHGSSGPTTVTLWDDRGEKMAETVVLGESVARGPTALPPSIAPAAEGLQPLRAVDAVAFLESTAIVSDLYPTHAKLGYLVIRSVLAASAPGLLSRLVGDNAAVLIGNRDGSLWVDLTTSMRVDGPALASDGASLTMADHVGAAMEVRDMPFQIWVGFPRPAILAPARTFLRRMIALGLLVALAGAILVRALTLRVTRPLGEMTAATEAVAAGDYTRQVGSDRRDELGRLGRAFDAMTARVSEDMTERARAARALLENDERLRYTLNAARVGTWQMDLATGTIEWSDTMGPLFGVDASDLPTRRDCVTDLIHPDDRGAVAAGLTRTAGEHELFFRALQPDGSYKSVICRARVNSRDGSPHLVGVCIDVTEQKMLEEQLRQSQKMEAIGKLAGGVAHDFNNMLTAILGFGTFLLDDMPADDPRRVQMTEILKAGRRAADLTAQLLAFSRRQLLQPVIVDVNSAVGDTTVMLERLIGEDIKLITKLAPTTVTVRADPVQLQQVVMNLAINARDAMPEGGRLTIEVTNVDLDTSYSGQHFKVLPGPYVLIAVTDTGVGMTAEVRARLFEPFFTTKKRGEGTGLGLATVYGAVKQAGGYIWAYGEPGKGSSFKVYLPRVDGDIAAAAPAAVEKPAGGNETILLVEDEEAVRLLTRMILDRAGYRVIEAGSAEEAAATHLQFSGAINVLLTDVVLPGSSGSDLFQRLTIRDPRLKVIYMSGYTDDAVFRHGRLEHGVAFIQKPFTADVLRRKIRDVLDS